MPMKVSFIAEKNGKTVSQLARDVWNFCHWLEENGGKTITYIVETEPQWGYLVASEHRGDINDGMWWVNSKNDEVWYVRTIKTHEIASLLSKAEAVRWNIDNVAFGDGSEKGGYRWKRAYLYRFGRELDPDVREICNWLMQEWRDVINWRPAKPIIERKYPDMAEEYEDVPTEVIAYWMASSALMSNWFRSQEWHYGRSEHNVYHFICKVLQREAWKLLSELEYRYQAEPPQQSSKKKTEAMIRDWKKAPEFIVENNAHSMLMTRSTFFTDAFIAMVGDTDIPFDIAYDFEAGIKVDKPENIPAQHKSRRQLLDEVIRLIGIKDELDTSSFEFEDIETLLEVIRKHLGAMKSEHIKGGA